MDAKYKDDLFRKYVHFHESKLDASENKQCYNDDYLRTAASALLSLHKIDPCYRFRLIKFYDVAENSLKSMKSSNLHKLYEAIEILETVGINLFLYPWKKEFKTIKTYTGPFVYTVKSKLPEEHIKQILSYMGYDHELGIGYKLKDLVDTTQVKRISFELFLARVECELLLEIHAQVKDKGYSEIDVISERKKSNEDVRGCSDEMKRRAEGTLNTSMARMILQKSASERASKDYIKPKVTKPSKSVDTYDSYLERKNKPPLMTTLSLRKEPIVSTLDDDIKDEIIRPSPSLLTMSSSPHGCSDDFVPMSPNPNGVLRTNSTTYSSYYSAQDDLDLYTDPDSRSVVTLKRPESVKPEVWLIKNDTTPNYQKRTHLAKETTSAQCQNCGASCSTTACQNCDSMIIYRPDYPTVKQSGFSVKAPLQNDAASPASALREKPLYCSQTSTQERASQNSTKLKPGSSVRCSFCNRPGASNTCMICSKVSCDECVSFYYHDYCCRKSEHHKFAPNNQLNYKSTQMSHLVFR